MVVSWSVTSSTEITFLAVQINNVLSASLTCSRDFCYGHNLDWECPEKYSHIRAIVTYQKLKCVNLGAHGTSDLETIV